MDIYLRTKRTYGFDIWAFSTDGESVQILNHTCVSNEGMYVPAEGTTNNVHTLNCQSKLSVIKNIK